jgi:YidC/Oxa1 family membrane protein insertase
MFWFLTRPIFWILENVYGLVGSFGVAILALTVIVKLVMFPLANNAYASMSKMRNLQPKMEEIKKKFKDDPQKQQQETMALYQKEKINPVAGCLPLVLQIPVFYALYKVLTVTIEMRHQPFLGFIHDLSARDPSVVWNLFGLIPWDPATLPLLGGLLVGPLGIGLLAVAYGLTMWLQTAMNPPAADPVQRQIFQFMPLVFTFIMAPFAAGLLVYWAWSNILTILQQYVHHAPLQGREPDRRLHRPHPEDEGRVIDETEFTPEEIEAARILFARPATFIMGAAKIEQLPDPDLPEIAFAGRSNVGKSSLINGLVGMHKLARASNEPGRTREVNFFDLDGRMRLVDLPGYGWAKASKTTVASSRTWAATICAAG